MNKAILHYAMTLIAIIAFAGLSAAQDVTTVEAKSSEISENLDLKAVASVLGDAKDLEDFENKLNDPDLKITNLDLNEDGEVDYLRVLETSEGNTHVLVIQAVIGEDQYQDVATVDIEKDNKGETVCQVVGDVNLYGPDYIIEPVYVHRPVIFFWFWGPHYHHWHSPYHWGYYPHHYHPWHPYPPHHYHSNININININNTYNRANRRYSKNSVNLSKKVSRNDFVKKHPDKVYKAGSNTNKMNNKAKTGTTAKTKTAVDSKNKTVSTAGKTKSTTTTSAAKTEKKKSTTYTTKTGKTKSNTYTTTTKTDKTKSSSGTSVKKYNKGGTTNKTYKSKTPSKGGQVKKSYGKTGGHKSSSMPKSKPHTAPKATMHKSGGSSGKTLKR